MVYCGVRRTLRVGASRLSFVTPLMMDLRLITICKIVDLYEDRQYGLRKRLYISIHLMAKVVEVVQELIFCLRILRSALLGMIAIIFVDVAYGVWRSLSYSMAHKGGEPVYGGSSWVSPRRVFSPAPHRQCFDTALSPIHWHERLHLISAH